MKPGSESTTRTPLDYGHFAVTWLGLIVAVAGIATLSIGALIFGGLLMTLGLSYFLVHASSD
jgi:hypothetical protein